MIKLLKTNTYANVVNMPNCTAFPDKFKRENMKYFIQLLQSMSFGAGEHT